MIERIEQFIRNQGLSVRAFEKTIDASDGMIRRAINNNTDIQSKWISLIAEKYPHINIEWLVTGRGSMLREEGCNQSLHQVSEPQQSQSSDTIAIYKELLKEKETEIKKLNREIGRLTERLEVFMAGREQIEDVEDADVAAVG